MKIEGQGAPVNLEKLTTSRAEALRQYSGQTKEAHPAPAAKADTVALSGDAQLAASVRQAAASAPAIRWDLVEQAKQKLAAGQVGADPLALADNLITHMLDE